MKKNLLLITKIDTIRNLQSKLKKKIQNTLFTECNFK